MEIPSSASGGSQDLMLQLASTRNMKAQNGEATGIEKTDQELKEAAKNFESILIHKLLESMSKTVPKSGLLDSFAGDMYESMFNEEVAKKMSERKGIGMADMIYRELSRLDEKVRQAGNPSQGAGSNAVINVNGQEK